MWTILAALSAVFLGFYDVFKKISVKENAVFPVLLFSSLSAAIVILPLYLLSRAESHLIVDTLFYIPTINSTEHIQILIKTLIVSSSWVFAYLAMKNLPITIVTPIRATGPLWTLLGAIVIYNEQLSILQWVGILTTLSFFYLFSLAGKTEGIQFTKNKWIFCIILATLLGATSGLYDKYLLMRVERVAVQAWFTIYQVPVMAIMTLLFWFPKRDQFKFRWSWAIPMIGIFLLIADYMYFYALSMDDALISVISALRRGGVIITFGFGAYLFKEKNLKTKTLLLIGILTGIMILLFSK